MTAPCPDSAGVTLVPGDAWGPPATSAAVAILDALGASLSWDIVPAGRRMADRTGDPLPKRLFSSARKSGLCLKGPLDLRDSTRPEATISPVESTFREELGVHATVHWAPLPGRPDTIFVRDWSESASATREWSVVSGVVEQLRAATSKAARRLVRLAIDVARTNRRDEIVFALAPDRPGLNDLYRQEIARCLRDHPPVEFRASTEGRLLARVTSGESIEAVILQPAGASDLLLQFAASRAGGPQEVPAMAVGRSIAIFEVSGFSVPTGDEPEALALVGMIRAAGRLLHHLGRHTEGERLAAVLEPLILDESTVATVDPRDFARSVSTMFSEDATRE